MCKNDLLNFVIPGNTKMGNRDVTYCFMILGWISFLFSISCKKAEEKLPIVIDLEGNVKNFQPMKLSEISKEISYIPLETDSLTLISTIKSLDLNDSLLIVNDLNKCLLFDRKGKFLRQIGRKGKGPGEYNFTQQLEIIDNKILVPCCLPSYINIYDLHGNFLYNVILPVNLIPSCQRQQSNCFFINDSTFLVQIPNQTGQETFRISVINNKGEVLKNFSNTTFFNRVGKYYSTTDYASGFYQYEEKIRYKEVLNDTIWQVEENELVPVCVIYRGEYGAPNDERGVPFKDVGYKTKKTIWAYNIFETKEYILFKTTFGSFYPFDFYKSINVYFGKEVKDQYYILGIFSRIDEKLFFISPTNKDDQIEPLGIENDIDGGINFVPNYLMGDSLMVGWFESSEMIRYINSSTFKQYKPIFPEKKKELEKLAASLNENDNPVLMLVKLKE
jgi:hypothetical protein